MMILQFPTDVSALSLFGLFAAHQFLFLFLFLFLLLINLYNFLIFSTLSSFTFVAALASKYARSLFHSFLYFYLSRKHRYPLLHTANTTFSKSSSLAILKMLLSNTIFICATLIAAAVGQTPTTTSLHFTSTPDSLVADVKQTIGWAGGNGNVRPHLPYPDATNSLTHTSGCQHHPPTRSGQ